MLVFTITKDGYDRYGIWKSECVCFILLLCSDMSLSVFDTLLLAKTDPGSPT